MSKEQQRKERLALIQRFADEVATWPLEKIKAGLPQPETVRRAEQRDAEKGLDFHP